MERTAITSLANPRVKQAVRLRKRAGRDAAGLFIIEGERELGLALEAGIKPTEVFLADAGTTPEQERLAEQCAGRGAQVFACSPPVRAKLSYGGQTSGILAVAARPERTLDRLQPGADPLVVVLEGLEKPGNLGAVLRTADAAGAAAVIVCEKGADLFNPNVVRASRGTVFTVPVAAAATEETVAWLKKNSISVVAVTPDGAAAFQEADLTGPKALVFGSEHAGLSRAWQTGAGATIRIPMRGRADSLNVSTAAGVMLYEAMRQRQRKCRS